MLSLIADQCPDSPLDETEATLERLCQEESCSELVDLLEERETADDDHPIILTECVALMRMASYVFIQTNEVIVREGYDQEAEKAEALRLGKFLPIDGYLIDVLRRDGKEL